MAALGLGYDDLRDVNPAIVYVSSQLLGSRGTRAHWSGYGPSAQAYGGLSHLWRFADSDPVPNMQNHPDLLAGHLVALGAIAGLHGRARTGVGVHCELAQVEVIVNLLGDLFLAEALAPGTVGPDGNDDSRGAPWGVFPCRRPRELVCHLRARRPRVGGSRRRDGSSAWAAERRWARAADRLAARDELGALVAEWTRSAVARRGHRGMSRQRGPVRTDALSGRVADRSPSREPRVSESDRTARRGLVDRRRVVVRRERHGAADHRAGSGAGRAHA